MVMDWVGYALMRKPVRRAQDGFQSKDYLYTAMCCTVSSEIASETLVHSESILGSVAPE